MTDLAVAGSTLFGASAVAALAVLDLHTSDDPLPTSGSPATTEPSTSPQRKGCGCLPRWLAWTLLLAVGGFALVSGACLDACTGTNRIRHVPAIHGRVVDMETGRPIPDVRITRYFVRNEFGGPGGGDQSIASGSWYTATTSGDGTFELPGWWGLARGISSIQWGEFKPGWTAGWGHILLDDAPRLDVAKLHLSDSSVQAETRHEGSRSTIILRLHRVNTPTAAEDHFSTLSILVRQRIVKERDFVADAAAYASGHELTEGMLYPLAELTDRINPSLEPQLTNERCRLLAAVANYCHSNPHSRECRVPFISLCFRDYETDCPASETR